MDFDIPDNLRIIAETVRRWVEKDLDPIANQVEEEGRIPDRVVATMRELGLFGLAIPEAQERHYHPIERSCRDLRSTRIYQGTSEIERLASARERLAD